MNAQALYEKLDMLKRHLQGTGTLALPVRTRAVIQDVLRELNALLPELRAAADQREMEAAYRVSQLLGQSLSLEEVLNQVIDAAIELTGAERGFIMLLEGESGLLQFAVARNLERKDLDTEAMQVSRSVIQQVLESGEGVLTTNAQTDPRFSGQASVVMYGLRSILSVPLQSRGRVIGVMYLDNRATQGMFARRHLEALQIFAAQAAIAIENARLYTLTDQALQARIAELEALAAFDRELNRDLELERVLDLTLQTAAGRIRAQSAWVALAHEESRTLRIVAGDGRGEQIAPDDPRVEPALRLTAPHRTPPGLLGPARLVVPLIRGSQRLGVLAVEREQAFSEEEAHFLARLAGHAVLAIQNARLIEAVQQANQAKTRFVSFVSHELRLPMTSIRGYTDLMLQGMPGPLTDMQKNFLEVIRSNVDRMARLVSDLSDISRLESGRLKLEPQRFSLHAAVQETVRSLEQKIAEKQQTLQLEVPDTLPEPYADPNRTVQVLTNLLSNAWKYTPEGGCLTVRARQEGDFLRVEVVDTGIGIREEDQKHLFSQFFRSEDPQVREQPGWGLGLHVTQQLVRLQGGEIGVQSTPGKGSTFWFTLPLHPPEEGATSA